MFDEIVISGKKSAVVILWFCITAANFLLGTPRTASSAEIIFENVLNEALANAVEMKIAKANEDIADAARLAATSGFYPRIYAKYEIDYTHDFGNKSGATSIGGQYYPDGTVWNSSSGISFQYDFFNFFSDYNAYRHAAKELEIRRYETLNERNGLAVTIADIYERLLLGYYGKKYYGLLSEYALELYGVQKRLCDAGLADKRAYYLAGAEAADYGMMKLDYEKSFFEALLQLSYYTGETYDPADVPADFDLRFCCGSPPDYEKYPEYKAALIKLEQKKLETNILGSKLLPRFSLYGGVNFQGRDRAAFDRAFTDTEALNYTLGLSVSLNIFDGFSTFRAYSKLKAETLELELEKLQIVKRINLENRRLAAAPGYLKLAESAAKTTSDFGGRIFAANDALRGADLTDEADALARRIETVKKLQEEKAVSIKFAAEAKRLEIINKYVR